MATAVDLLNTVNQIQADGKVICNVQLHRLDVSSIGSFPLSDETISKFPIFSKLQVHIKMQPNSWVGNTLYVGQSIEMNLTADWLDMDAVIDLTLAVIEPMLRLKKMGKGVLSEQ